MKVNACLLSIIVVGIMSVFISEVASQNGQKNRPSTTKRPVSRKNPAAVVPKPGNKPVAVRPAARPGSKAQKGKAKPVARAQSGNKKKNGKNPGKRQKPATYSSPLLYSMPLDYEADTTGSLGAPHDPVNVEKLVAVTPMPSDDYDTGTNSRNGNRRNNRGTEGGATKMTKNKYSSRRKHNIEEEEEEETMVYEQNGGRKRTSEGHGGIEEYDYGDYAT